MEHTQTIVAQISDLHVLPGGRKLSEMVDTTGMLEAAVSHLNAFSPRPDVVLATGDLVEDGSTEGYAHLAAILGRLEMPCYAIPGNHDDRGAMVEGMATHTYLPREGFLQYAVDDHPVRLVGLDTTLPGHDEGRMCAERLRWIDETLGAAPSAPTLLFMHHPPFDSHIWWGDAMGLGGAGQLEAVVARHRQVRLVVCGHLHRNLETSWAGTRASAAPSTCHQTALDLRPESPPHVVLEPPACRLHVWNGEHFVSHTSYTNTLETIDLVPMMGGDWPALRQKLRDLRASLA